MGTCCSALKPAFLSSWASEFSYTDSTKPKPSVLWTFIAAPMNLPVSSSVGLVVEFIIVAWFSEFQEKKLLTGLTRSTRFPEWEECFVSGRVGSNSACSELNPVNLVNPVKTLNVLSTFCPSSQTSEACPSGRAESAHAMPALFQSRVADCGPALTGPCSPQLA